MNPLNPPQNIDAEASLLGCIMQDNSIILQIDTTPEMFYKITHQQIFAAMKELKTIDIITLFEYLGPTKIKRSELAGIANSVISTSNFKDYATIVGVARKLPETVLQEDEKLLMYYDVASMRVGE